MGRDPIRILAFIPEKLYLRRDHGANLSASVLPSTMETGQIVRRYLSIAPALARHPYFREHFPYFFAWLVSGLEFSRQAWKGLPILWSFARTRGWNPELRRQASSLVRVGARQMFLPARTRVPAGQVARFTRVLADLVRLSSGTAKATTAQAGAC
jgi:hypothetical protein